MNKCFHMKGYKLYLIPTKKFKNITISFKLLNKLDRATCSKRMLLCFMFAAGTKNYPTPQAMSRYLESLYGMKFGCSISTKGKAHVLNLNSICINEEYLPYKEDLLLKQVKTLNEILTNLNAKNGKFDDNQFEIKKKELIDRIIASNDDKISYSSEKLFDYMGKDQPLGINGGGYIEDIKKITNEELYAYYQECLKEDEKHVFVVGDIDENVAKIFKENLVLEETENLFGNVYHFQKTRKDLLEIIEVQDITQAKLNMGYRINSDLMSRNHYAFRVFNMIFGGSGQSKLFKTVREKNSLCYYISSNYDSFNGIMVLSAGIESKDYEKTKELIAQCLKEMQEGKFTDEELEIAKMMIVSSSIKANDDPTGMLSVLYNRVITGKAEDDINFRERIANISRQDIINVCQDIELDTIFLLKGRDA